MQLLTFFVFLSCILGTISEEEQCEENNPCACKFKKSGKFIDLSNIGRNDGMPRFFILTNEVNTVIAYNPCHPISYSTQDFAVKESACSNVAACIITLGSPNGSAPTQNALAYQQDAAFFYDSDGFIMIKYRPARLGEKSLTVNLTCGADVDQELYINTTFSFILETRCACDDQAEKCRSYSPPQSKSGLSTGSILLITFFVIVLVYVGCGILFNFCRGAHGTELLPNSEFWTEFPKLIVDGFLFTCSCFGRRSAYADV